MSVLTAWHCNLSVAFLQLPPALQILVWNWSKSSVWAVGFFSLTGLNLRNKQLIYLNTTLLECWHVFQSIPKVFQTPQCACSSWCVCFGDTDNLLWWDGEQLKKGRVVFLCKAEQQVNIKVIKDWKTPFTSSLLSAETDNHSQNLINLPPCCWLCQFTVKQSYQTAGHTWRSVQSQIRKHSISYYLPFLSATTAPNVTFDKV